LGFEKIITGGFMRNLLVIILSISIFSLQLSALADPPEDIAKDSPCGKIRDVCKAAGFTKGGHANEKGLGRDCMSDLLLGRSVPGVNLTPEQTTDLGKCKAKPHPCLPLVDACDSGGNPKGCVKKLLAGESIEGVIAPQASDLAACKSQQEKRQEKKVSPAL
jgi:hypothetical protein